MSVAVLVTDALSAAVLLQPPQFITNERRGPEHSSSERHSLNITQLIFNERRGSGTYCAERRGLNIKTNILYALSAAAFITDVLSAAALLRKTVFHNPQQRNILTCKSILLNLIMLILKFNIQSCY